MKLIYFNMLYAIFYFLGACSIRLQNLVAYLSVRTRVDATQIDRKKKKGG
jgi:hypothetical protein